MFSSAEGWKKISDVGRGAFGFVSLHQHQSGRHVVIKQIQFEKDCKINTDAVANEVNVLANLKHPNIIAFYSHFIAADTLNIVMEHAPHGNLNEYLAKQKTLLSSDEVLHWFCQLLMAVNYLHSQNILHRDIKPQNILLCGANGSILKLSDFGISKILSNSFTTSAFGTPEYMPPETCHGHYYHQSDIWSMGCVLYNLVTLKHPFDASNIADLMSAIMSGQFKEPITCPIYGDALCDIIRSMLQHNWNHRPTTSVLIAHPLIAQNLYLLPLCLGASSFL
nr:PREDICTED: serine/threonine-protein kinase Nek8-like [Bemisia tabaci]